MIPNRFSRLSGGIAAIFFVMAGLTACADQPTSTPVSAVVSAAPVVPNPTPTATSVPLPTPTPIVFGTVAPTVVPTLAVTVVPAVTPLQIATPTSALNKPVPTTPLVTVADGGLLPVYIPGAEIALTDNNRTSLRGLVSDLLVKQVIAYHSPDTLDKVRAFYETEYKRLGWQNYIPGTNPLLSSFKYFLSYQRNGQVVIIVLGDGETVGNFGIQGVSPVETVIIVLTNFIPTNPAAGTPGAPRSSGGIIVTAATDTTAGGSTTAAPTTARATTAAATTAPTSTPPPIIATPGPAGPGGSPTPYIR